MSFTEEGLVLGNGTVLVKAQRDRHPVHTVFVDGAEDRIFALLLAAYGRGVGARVLDNIRRASRYWNQGETELAAIELALSGLPPLRDVEEGSFRLFVGDKLLAEGLNPHELMELCGLDPAR